ncbi:MAG: MalY/PatB family protein [Oscillospiraceae bacterium]
MNYNFDTLIDRSHTNSLKWDIAPNELPMWVADMDFQTAPEIIQAIQKRAEHGIFGYSILPDEWYHAYMNWWESRHHVKFSRKELIFSTGVIPTLSSCVRKLTTPAENVLILTPVYNIFYNCIRNNGRNVLECSLLYADGVYSIDWKDLENKLSDLQTTLMILSNPHNPIGKIWNKETLSRIGELAKKYGVIVISDEIHCDITDPEKEYIPFMAVSEICANNSITCISPTKTFNIAGLQSSAVVVRNPKLRHKVWRALNTDECGEPNAFAVQATISAFNEGGAWLDALRNYLYENKQIVKNFLLEKLPEIQLVPSEATYLLWLDCSAVTENSGQLAKEIRQKTGLYLSSGMQYGKGGETFLRMNIACPSVYVEDGLNRLERALHDA